jgi:hypothetical protein
VTASGRLKRSKTRQSSGEEFREVFGPNLGTALIPKGAWPEDSGGEHTDLPFRAPWGFNGEPDERMELESSVNPARSVSEITEWTNHRSIKDQ